MQEKDTEAVSEERNRRRRVSRLKNMIIYVLSGWVVLSMILIICLFVLLFQTRHQVKELIVNGQMQDAQMENAQWNAVGSGLESGKQQVSDTEYEPEGVVSSGIIPEENLASESDTHKVYLTFEDGPSEHTAAILDVLKEKNVKATFFVTGQEGEAAQAVYKRIAEEGHTLGMHSYSNKYSEVYQSEEAFEKDVTQLRTYLFESTGIEPVYYRFPGGSNNQITNVPMEQLIQYLNQEGIVYFDWNVSSGDATANAYTTDEIVANVVGDVVKYKTSVVLMHDAKDTAINPEALGAVIDALIELDAEILPIDESTSVIQLVKTDYE